SRGPQLLDRSDAGRINWQDDAQQPSEAAPPAAPPPRTVEAQAVAPPVSYWLSLLGSDEEPAQQEAVGALSRLGQAAVPELIGALNDDDWQVRNQAAVVLGAIGPEAKAAVPALIDVLQDDDKYFRSHGAVALGQIGREARVAVPALRKALKDPEEDVRR